MDLSALLTVGQTALELGLICSLTVLALFLSYSMLNVCDLSTDGCFTLGAAVGAVVAAAGHPLLSIPAAMLAGVCSGLVTALLQTKFGIDSLLSGIIVNTGLYSVNIAVMAGSAQINLYKADTVFSMTKDLLAGTPLAGQSITVVAAVAVILTVVFLTLFLNGWGWPFGPRATTRIWSAPPPSTRCLPPLWACAWPTPSPACPAA